MTNPFMMPPTGFGPGSQPLDQQDETLEYMPLPQDMRTYSPRIPEIEDHAGADLTPAFEMLGQIALAAGQAGQDGELRHFDLSDLDAENRALIIETMGSGEVSAKVRGVPSVAVQESVFAGIWMLQTAERSWIEVAPVPACVTGCLSISIGRPVAPKRRCIPV